MSGEHQVCPMCGDDMCDGRCYDALLDRLANAGIDLIARDRELTTLRTQLESEQHRRVKCGQALIAATTQLAEVRAERDALKGINIEDIEILLKYATSMATAPLSVRKRVAAALAATKGNSDE